MQFHLEPDELKLLAELLLEQDPISARISLTRSWPATCGSTPANSSKRLTCSSAQNVRSKTKLLCR